MISEYMLINVVPYRGYLFKNWAVKMEVVMSSSYTPNGNIGDG